MSTIKKCVMKKDVWLAIIEVAPINNNTDLGEAKGAFVNVAYKATSKVEFIKMVQESFNEFDFKVLQIDEVERGDQLTIDNPENAEKFTLLKALESETHFTWGDFYTYEE
jgi:hypothetical protein